MLCLSERFRAINKLYYRNAAAGIVVYDITNRVRMHSSNNTSQPPKPVTHHSPCVSAQTSFETMKTLWLDKLYAVDTPHLIVAIVGNKCDLEARREVPAEVCTPRLCHVTEHPVQAYCVAHTQATLPWYQPGRGTVC